MNRACRACHASLSDTARVCPRCGKPVWPRLAASSPTAAPAPGPRSAPAGNPPPRPRQRSAFLVLPALLLGLCAVCSSGAVVLPPAGDGFEGWATVAGNLGFGRAIPTATTPLARVLATRTEAIGPEGGAIQADGWQIRFPAGAVASKTTVSVRLLDAQPWLDSKTAALLLDVTAPKKEFRQKIEFRVPLPSGYTPDYAGAARVLLWEPDTAEWLYESAAVQVREGEPELVLETDHLSTRLFKWLKQVTEYRFPPEQAGPLEMPHCSQGNTLHCWAAALQMGAESHRHSPGDGLYGFLGAMGSVSGGPSPVRIRWSGATGAYLARRAGAEPERIHWTLFQQQIQLEYIQRQIAFEARPVLLFSYPKSHAFMLVGYPDRKSFYVHDPQQVTGNLYKRMTLEDLGLDQVGNTTIVILAPPAADRPLISVNLLDDFLDINGPGGDYYAFRWDASDPRGYVMRANRPMPHGRIVATIPGDVTEISADRASFSGIEVANAYLAGDPKRVTLRIEVLGHGPNKTGYVQTQTVDVAPKTTQRVIFTPIPVDEFRDPAPTQVRYTFKVAAVVDGKNMDESSFDFVLEPRPTPTLPPRSGASKCICPDGSPLPLDPSLGCSGLLIPPMDVDWQWCYRTCVEACGCDPDDPDLTCACKCVLGE